MQIVSCALSSHRLVHRGGSPCSKSVWGEGLTSLATAPWHSCMDAAQTKCNTSRGGVPTGPWSGFDGPPLVQAIPSRLPFVDLRPAFVAEKAAGLLAKLLRGETPGRRRISVAPVFVCSQEGWHGGLKVFRGSLKIGIDLTFGQVSHLCMSYDLIAVGLNAVDVLVRLPESVVQDDKQFVEDLVIQGGAPVGSGCCGVARLGYRVGMVARLGRNTLSAICLEEFRGNGVDTALIVRDETSRPAIALVEIDPRTAARTVFIQMDNYGYLRAADIPGAEIARAKALLVDSYDLDATEAALEAAAGTACRSILDFESGDQDRLKKLLGMGTDPILPLAAARGLTGMSEPGDVLRALGDLCPGQVLVTDGTQGSWALDREAGGIIHQPAFVVDAVDTTGCGDAFHAGYIVGVLEGWPLALRMEFGSLLASRVAGRVGGRTALPSRKNDLIRNDISNNLRQHLIL